MQDLWPEKRATFTTRGAGRSDDMGNTWAGNYCMKQAEAGSAYF